MTSAACGGMALGLKDETSFCLSSTIDFDECLALVGCKGLLDWDVEGLAAAPLGLSP